MYVRLVAHGGTGRRSGSDGSGSMMSNTARYGLDRSNVAHSTCESHPAPRYASQAVGSVPPRPGTTSRSTPRVTSTTDVDHNCRRHTPARANRVSAHPQSGHLTDPVHLRHRASVPAHLAGASPPCPIRQTQPGRRDPSVDTGPRTRSAVRLGTAPPVLAPYSPHRSPERRQIRPTPPPDGPFDLSWRPASPTGRPRSTALDV